MCACVYARRASGSLHFQKASRAAEAMNGPFAAAQRSLKVLCPLLAREDPCPSLPGGQC